MFQPTLFSCPLAPLKPMPGGFSYAEDFLTQAEESALIATFQTLPFKHDEHNGYKAHRRLVGYGWHGPVPGFLTAFFGRIATFAGIPAHTISSALISEYTPGAAIGWHRDKPTIGHVIGISLAGPCHFRLRRQTGSTWQRFTVNAQPRSIYCMSGESRTHWQHSIPAVQALRYSITFRNF